MAVSLFQALTSVQEQTLSMVPKMLAVMGATLLILAPALQYLGSYTAGVLEKADGLRTSVMAPDRDTAWAQRPRRSALHAGHA